MGPAHLTNRARTVVTAPIPTFSFLCSGIARLCGQPFVGAHFRAHAAGPRLGTAPAAFARGVSAFDSSRVPRGTDFVLLNTIAVSSSECRARSYFTNDF